MAILGHPPLGAAASLPLVCMTCRHPPTQVQSHSASVGTSLSSLEADLPIPNTGSAEGGPTLRLSLCHGRCRTLGPPPSPWPCCHYSNLLLTPAPSLWQWVASLGGPVAQVSVLRPQSSLSRCMSHISPSLKLHQCCAYQNFMDHDKETV